MSFDKAPAISFNDLIGEGQESLSMERVESLLSYMTSAISDKANTNPNHLVRVVHDGRVIWMSQKQAIDYLETEEDSTTLQNSVQKALRGELKIIRQELEILIALARYTLTHFKEMEAINRQEIERFEPSLTRRQNELNEGISRTSESEAILNEKRRRAPLLAEYENLMGEFINAKSAGNQSFAMELAQKLKQKKKQYLLLSRAIEPDVRTIHYHRLNLQKTKKRILNTQNELCSSRKDFLQIEIDQLRNSVGEVQEELDAAQETGLGDASEEIDRMRVYDLDDAKSQIDEKIGELEALDKETAVLDKQEQQVDCVIQHIQENILQEVEQKMNFDQIKSQGKKIDTSSPQSSPKQKKGSGMHIQRRD